MPGVPKIIETLRTGRLQGVDVLRLDLIDEEISGNKWFKLRHNLIKAADLGLDRIITFGGVHSNHIAATAALCKREGFQCVGIIRGYDTGDLSPTLSKAADYGMELKFVSRDEYMRKDTPEFKASLDTAFGPHLLIPEGGRNPEGLRGCMEILGRGWDYDHIFCACGTGTTFAGLVAAASPGQRVIGISVLKGRNTLVDDVRKLLSEATGETRYAISDSFSAAGHVLTNEYAFSGFAGCDGPVLDLKREFEQRHGIALDHLYTAKMFFAIDHMVGSGVLPAGSRILAIHTGGLQGNAAFEERYQLSPSR